MGVSLLVEVVAHRGMWQGRTSVLPSRDLRIGFVSYVRDTTPTHRKRYEYLPIERPAWETACEQQDRMLRDDVNARQPSPRAAPKEVLTSSPKL